MSRRSRRQKFVSLRIVIVVVVVVTLGAGAVGYVIGDHVGTNNANRSTATSASRTATTVSHPDQTTTTPLAPIDRTQTVVVVANGSGVKGAAAAVTGNLKALGYKTLTPANTTGTVTIPFSQVYFAPGGNDAAAHVISELRLANVVAQPIPADTTLIPLAAPSRLNATVIVVLGTDLASSIAGTPTVAGTGPATAAATVGVATSSPPTTR